MSLLDLLRRLISFAWLRRPPLPETGYSIRIEWGDNSHEFIGLESTNDDAIVRMRKLQDHFESGVGRPRSYQIVPITSAAWRQHRHIRPCRSADCPGAVAV
jgi:hypothetical protein